MDFSIDAATEKRLEGVRELGRTEVRPLGLEADRLGRPVPPDHPFYERLLRLGLGRTRFTGDPDAKVADLGLIPDVTQMPSVRTNYPFKTSVTDLEPHGKYWIVANYEGSISGFRGDGLLALFGAPILHENDAERAVLAAIDMVRVMGERELAISVGINTALMSVG